MISYYRRFIPNCSRIVSPLYKLLKKDAKFVWTEAQENTFQHLKSKLISLPILQYPNFSKEFILTIDASNSGLGAVLSQGPVGKHLPVAYAVRSLNKPKPFTRLAKRSCQLLCGLRNIFDRIYTDGGSK